MAEWLRRLTANQLGSAREGSNPSVREPVTFLNFLTPLPVEEVLRNILAQTESRNPKWFPRYGRFKKK